MFTKRAINPKDFLNLKQNIKKINFIASLGNLAPSSHNMQPWFFKINEGNLIIVPNKKLRLEVADPQGREFYITTGSLVGLIKLVSKSYGLEFEYLPCEEVENEVGRFVFKNLEPTNIDYVTLDAIVNRHNSRLPYKRDLIPNEYLEKLKNFAGSRDELKIVSSQTEKNKIEALILDSVEEAFSDRGFCKELYPWIKNSWFRSEDGLPGYNLGMPYIVSIFFPVLTWLGITGRKQVQIHKNMLDNCSTYCIICTNEDSPASWSSVGEVMIQGAVEAEKNNISIGIMQAAIENPTNRIRLKELLQTNMLPQMFFRLGYCDLPHIHSPRRSIEKVIVN